MPPDLSIIIVNYNSNPELRDCLRALENVRTELAFEVLIVDNASSDGSLSAAQTEFPSCVFLPLDANRGFAGACNAGLEIATGRQAMLLNPDTEVQPGALTKLLQALSDHPNWGIVGPRMENETGRIYTAARRLPTPWYLFCELTGLGKLFSHTKLFNGYLYGECDPTTLDAVEQIEGSALMISAAARQRVGNLDPQFFIFFEEVDWCQRVREAGFEIHVVQDAVIWHHRSTTMSRFFVPSRVHHAESAMKYFHKHGGGTGLQSLRNWMGAALWIRSVLLRLSLLFNANETTRTRLAGTQAMRKVYRRGLTG